MTISLRATPSWLSLIFVGLLLAGCGGADNEPAGSQSQAEPSQSSPETESGSAATQEPEASEMTQAEPAATEEAAEDAAGAESTADTDATDEAVTVDEEGVAQVTIGATDQMQYTVTEFAVEAGQEVELTLVHEGQLPVEQMGHNVAILQMGEDYMAFGNQVTDGEGSLDNDYLPEGVRDGLIAYTSLIGGGETDTIRFTAPDTPGDYPFLCTFPGHYPIMNGVMTVR